MNIEQVKNKSWQKVLQTHFMEMVEAFSPELVETLWGTKNIPSLLSRIEWKDRTQTNPSFRMREGEGLAGFAIPIDALDQHEMFEMDFFEQLKPPYLFVNAELDVTKMATGDTGWRMTWPVGKLSIRDDYYKDMFVKVIEARIQLVSLRKR